MSTDRRAARVLAMVALLCAPLAVGCSGCSDKNAAKHDAGLVAQSLTTPTDAGLAANGDGGLDDAAMPASSGEDLQARMRHLLEAVSQNNPDLAGDAIFPRDGYVAAKDAPDPPKLWEKKVSSTFRRSVERMHKRMKGVEHARFVGFELGRSVTQLSPGKRDFKKPLWRVKHSKLSFMVDGKPRHIDIAEMTAWRGAWYVTRLR